MADNTHALVLASASSQDVRITDASQVGLDFTGNHTIELWLQAVTAPGTDVTYRIVNKNDTTGENRGYDLNYADASGVKRFLYAISADGTSSNRVVRALNTTLKAGVWYHFAITCTIANANSTKFVFWLNGVSQGNGSDPGFDAGTVNAIFNNTAPFIVGNQLTNPAPANIKVNNLAVYNSVLSDALIKASATDKTGRTGLQGWWKFNNALTDSGPNGNTLTNTNSATFDTDTPWGWYTDIVLDAVASGRANPGTSLTYAHTTAGANKMLFVAIYTAGASDVVTGVTYNGVAMSRLDAQIGGSSAFYTYLYGLIAPAAGANNIIISSSSSVDIQSVSASYNEMQQSSQPDATGKANATTGDNVTGSVTPVTDRTFIVSMSANDQDNPVGDQNVVMRKFNVVVGIGDSAGVISPAAATNFNWKRQGTGNCNWGTIGAAIKSINIVTSSIKKLMGVTQAQVKKVSPTAIAGIKKVSGVANV